MYLRSKKISPHPEAILERRKWWGEGEQKTKKKNALAIVAQLVGALSPTPKGWRLDS